MYDLIVIGGGPAGLTAAIYAIRKRLNVLLISKDLGGKTNFHLELPNQESYLVIRGVEVVDKFKSELEYEDKAKNKFLLSEKSKPLAPLRTLVADIEPFSAAAIEDAVKAWAEKEEMKLGAIAQPARAALTGRSVSPGIFEVMRVLGRADCLARIEAQVSKVQRVD